MPAGAMFSGRPEKVNPAVPPPTVAVPVELLSRCLDLAEWASEYTLAAALTIALEGRPTPSACGGAGVAVP